MSRREKPHGTPPSPEAMFKSSDTDGDGKISKDDLMTAMSQHGSLSDDKVDDVFGKLDLDGDGLVTETEFIDGMKRMHREHHTERSGSEPATSESKIKKLIEQLPKTESYEADGTTKQTLLQILFSVTA